MPRTRAPARSASRVVPYAVTATNSAVRNSRPHGSSRKSLLVNTPCIATGCTACRSSARRPASAMDGSACTRQVTESGPYSPGSRSCAGSAVISLSVARSAVTHLPAQEDVRAPARPGVPAGGGRPGRYRKAMWPRYTYVIGSPMMSLKSTRPVAPAKPPVPLPGTRGCWHRPCSSEPSGANFASNW